MAIGNIDSMSSMLARMTPQQRQQYAMMHHNDPFVVSLAKFVNDIEQQKAQALQSQRLQAMPPMPPVVDQEIAAMAPQPMPEETGIGALPERSMETHLDDLTKQQGHVRRRRLRRSRARQIGRAHV